MISFKRFVEEVVKGVADAMGHEYEVTARTVTKNNGITLTGVIITKKGSRIIPAIYLDEPYKKYIVGKTSIKMTIAWVMNIYRKQGQNIPLISSHMEKFQNYQDIENLVAFKLINTEKNQELLSQIPSIPFENLSIVFYLYLGSSDKEVFTILIRNEFLEIWKVTKEKLYEDATKNTPQLLPETFRELGETITEMRRQKFNDYDLPIQADYLEEDLGMYVLTNQKHILGAACLLYPGVLKRYADQLNNDLLILPSSTHEVLILPYDETVDIDEMRSLVQWVNVIEVSEEEQLSGQIYLYKRLEDQMMVAS